MKEAVLKRSVCTWERLLDELLQNETKVERDEIDLIPIKTSCRKEYFWIAEVNVENQHNTSTTEFGYCPFCGLKKQEILIVDL